MEHRMNSGNAKVKNTMPILSQVKRARLKGAETTGFNTILLSNTSIERPASHLGMMI